MAGRDKLTRGTTFSWHSQSIGGDLVPGSLNGLGFKAGKIDMTGESHTVANAAADRKENQLTAKFIANNTATTGSTTLFNADLGTAQTLVIDIGTGGAVPTSGDLEFSGTFVLLDATLSNDGGKYVHNCVFEPGSSTAPAWGIKT